MPMPVFDNDGNMLSVEVKDVYAIYKENKTRRIVVITEAGEFYLPTTVKQVANIMKSSGFLQVDKKSIINVSKVKEFENNKVTVDGSTFEVSRRSRRILRRMLSEK